MPPGSPDIRKDLKHLACLRLGIALANQIAVDIYGYLPGNIDQLTGLHAHCLCISTDRLGGAGSIDNGAL